MGRCKLLLNFIYSVNFIYISANARAAKKPLRQATQGAVSAVVLRGKTRIASGKIIEARTLPRAKKTPKLSTQPLVVGCYKRVVRITPFCRGVMFARGRHVAHMPITNGQLHVRQQKRVVIGHHCRLRRGIKRQ